MTYLEEFMKNRSGDELISAGELIDDFCPHDFFPGISKGCSNPSDVSNRDCVKCWNREYNPTMSKLYVSDDDLKAVKGGPDSLKMDDGKKIELDEKLLQFLKDCKEKATDDEPKIVDSGNRREFPTGAVRDICEGKGRCDLLPLDVVFEYLDAEALDHINAFQQDGDINHLYDLLDLEWRTLRFGCPADMLLEVAIHFEDGCKKYGENNWRKGIPAHCYIDSAVRHYLKFLRGDTDERHDRAFVWNILCCIWTCVNKPELNDYRKEEEKSDENC